MAGILSRKVLIGKGSDGFLRVSDWCAVTTSLGGGWEPFSINRNQAIKGSSNLDFQWSEQANRIDDLGNYDPNCQIFDERTIGGIVGVPLEGY